jgi:hypothetical protein
VLFKRNSHFGFRVLLDWLMRLKLRFAALAHAESYRCELYDLESAFCHSFGIRANHIPAPELALYDREQLITRGGLQLLFPAKPL